MPDDRAQAAEQTRRLRARFPRWGILFDPLESVWVAVRGKRTLVAASSPEMPGERACHAGGEACVCDLAAEFEVTEPTISCHLKVLKQAGLIGSQRRGTWSTTGSTQRA